MAKQQASLRDYFADRQVQAYLESLPTDAQITNEWAAINHQSFLQSDLHHFHYHTSNTTQKQEHDHQPANPELPVTHSSPESESTQDSIPRWNRQPGNRSVGNQASQIPPTVTTPPQKTTAKQWSFKPRNKPPAPS